MWVCASIWKRILGLVQFKSKFQLGIISGDAKLRNCYLSCYNNLQTRRATHLPRGVEGQWCREKGQNPAKGGTSGEPRTSPWRGRWTLRLWYSQLNREFLQSCFIFIFMFKRIFPKVVFLKLFSKTSFIEVFEKSVFFYLCNKHVAKSGYRLYRKCCLV